MRRTPRPLLLVALSAVAAAVGIIALLVDDDAESPLTSVDEAQASNPDCSLPFKPGEGTTVLGGVQFPGYVTRGWEQGDALQSSSFPGGRRFSKQALGLRGAEPVTFRVPADTRGPVWLVGWDQEGKPKPVDRIVIDLGVDDACEGVWAGGFVFERRQCLRLSVETKGRRVRVPFGLARDCR